MPDLPFRRRIDSRRALAALACVAACAGCTTILSPPAQHAFDQLMTPTRTAPDSVTLEIFHARVPIDKEDAADRLWNEVDEQAFDADLRRRLLVNGLRAGTVGASLPAELAELLVLQAAVPQQPNDADRVITGESAVPRVTRRVLQINRREAASLQAAEVRDEVHVVVNDDGSLQGRTYRQAESIYSLRAQAIEGQRVRLELTPELQHGELRQRYAGSDLGTFKMAMSRDRVAFDKLTMQVALAPGELLVMGCLREPGSTLGAAFHSTATEGRHERKLILVRVLETPPSEILAEAK